MLLTTCLIGLTILLCNSALAHNESEFMNEEDRLFHDLTKFNRLLRPVNNAKDTVNITLGLALIDILEINEDIGYITIEGWLKLKWIAPNLQWDHNAYQGIRDIKIPMDQIWQPDITLYNGGANAVEFQNKHAVISSTGSVLWIPQVVIKSKCAFNMRNFPYDSHDCSMKFGSWVYHGNEINLNLFGDYFAMDLSNFGSHLEWEIRNTSAKKNVKQYACCMEPYVDVTFNLHLKRKGSYMNHVCMLPMVFVAILSPFMFLLPYRQSQRFSLGGCMLISLIVLVVGLNQIVPRTFDGVPLIAVYYISVLVLLLFCMLASAIILNLAEKVTTPPRILRTIIGDGLGRLLCVRREDYSSLVDNDGEGSIELRKTPDVTWRYIAQVLDKFCFIFYIILTIILALSLATPR